MSGLILTAKAFQKRLAKRKIEITKELQKYKDHKIDCDWTVQDRMEAEIEAIANDFRQQCKLAVKLRDIAIEEGLLKDPTAATGENIKKLDAPATLADKYALITIRPAPGTCPVYFVKAVADFIERPWVRGAEYHFEQTGECEQELGDGFHVHIVAICKKSIRVQEILESAAKDFECKYSIQIGNNRNKFLKTETDLEYALNYIRGDKHDPTKATAVTLNNEWRQLMDIQDVYYAKSWDNRESSPENAVIIQEVDD